jgi:hypothetical protein
LTRWRHHQTRSLVRVEPGVMVLAENISSVIAQTRVCILVKKASSPGSRAAISSSGRPSASLNRDVHFSPIALVMP